MCRKLIYLVSFVLVLSLVSTDVAFGGKVWEGRISSDSDDVEQDVNGGGMDLSSSDLEIFNDGGVQVIGLRFIAIPIPKGAIVDNAYIELTCDEIKSGTLPVSVLIEGELSPDTVTFSNAAGDVTNRPTTTANVVWVPEDWTEVGQKDRSLDITSIIQEIIDQDGWAMGNALVLILRDDPDNPSEGIRTAHTVSNLDGAPLLHIVFRGKFAVDPTPADGALYEDTTAILSWSPGLNSVSHDVYFGENIADVSDGTSDTFQGNQTDAFFTIGIPGFPVPDGLVPGITYYWRIDEVEADGTTINKGDIWSFTVPSLKAYNHNLSDGAAFIDQLTQLSWTPGSGAKVHTVFFGDNYDDVSNAVEGLPQAASTYDPGPLESDKTYYWRVDEFDGIETYKGDTLSFTTIGARGTGLRGDYYTGTNFDTLELTRIDPQVDFPWGGGAPDPAVGGSNISVRWTGEFSAQFTETYTFYTISDDGVRLWVDGKLILENWTAHGDTENLGTIDLVAGHFYSIVLEYYQGGGGSIAQLGIKGPRTEKQLIPTALLWPPIKARNPNPSNGAVDVRQTPLLVWGAGEAAASHEVYFGTEEAVKNADTSSSEYKGSRDLGSESYDPGQLEWNTTYYWRVDEIEDGGTIQRGNVWSFTTANFLIVDDFETYNDLNEDEPASNRIYLAWVDGFDDPAANGSVVGYPDPPFAEQTIVHSGNQSMPLAYDNAVGKSEATLTLTSNRDWTVKGVDTLTIWYIGDAANSAETMYVMLNGSANVDNDNPDAALATGWTEWNIPLQAFADQGVNLANVNSITLGLRSGAGGSGMLYFDDIRLYAPVPAEVPEGLIGLWNFEEGSGATAADSSGNGLDGTISGALWVSPGADGTGSCLDFDGQGSNRVSLGNFDITGDGLTIACWYKADNLDTPGNDPRLFSKAIGGSSQDHWFMVSSSRVDNDKVLRFRLKTDGDTGELKADTATGTIELNIWTHMAAVWDGAAMRLYKNGVEVGSFEKGGTLSTNPDAKVSIGNQPPETGDRPWDGLIDDVRIYNRGLSEAEISDLAGL